MFEIQVQHRKHKRRRRRRRQQQQQQQQPLNDAIVVSRRSNLEETSNSNNKCTNSLTFFKPPKSKRKRKQSKSQSRDKQESDDKLIVKLSMLKFVCCLSKALKQKNKTRATLLVLLLFVVINVCLLQLALNLQGNTCAIVVAALLSSSSTVTLRDNYAHLSEDLYSDNTNNVFKSFPPTTTATIASPNTFAFPVLHRSPRSVVSTQTQTGVAIIDAPLGGSAILACNITSDELGDEAALILWFADEKSMVPIFSVDARASSIREARAKPGATLEGRATVKLRQQLLKSASSSSSFNRRTRRLAHRHSSSSSSSINSSQQPPFATLVAELTIDALSDDDAGAYSCRVDFKRARARTSNFELRIAIPPPTPTIRALQLATFNDNLPQSLKAGQEGGGAGGVIGPFNEGANVRLECETIGGWPTPALIWLRDGLIVDSSYELVDSLTGSSLGFRKLVVASSSSDFSSTTTTMIHASSNNAAIRFEQDASFFDSLKVINASATLSNSDSIDQTPVLLPADADSENEAGGGGGAPPLFSSLGFANTPTSNSVSTSSLTASTVNANQWQIKAQATLVRNSLELRAVSRSDLLANFTCVAPNSRLLTAPSASTLLELTLRPTRASIENERSAVIAGKPLEVVCRATGSRPAASIGWFRAAANAPLARLPLGRSSNAASSGGAASVRELIDASTANETLSTLTFTPQPSDAGALVVCRAENPTLLATLSSNEQRFVEDSWKLDVHYAPVVRVSLGAQLNADSLLEGQDAYLECSVDAYPAASSVRWWLNGVELDSDRANGIVMSNQSLVLQRVSRRQRGTYTCSAANAVGESTSNSVHLRVRFAPICATNSKRVYGAVSHEPVVVECRVEADPPTNVTFRWAYVAAAIASSNVDDSTTATATTTTSMNFNAGDKRAPLVYLDESKYSTPTNEPLVSYATFAPRSESELGSLLCFAQSSLGATSEPCAFKLVQASAPETPPVCELVNATDVQLAVSCSLGDDGGARQSLRMEVFDANSRKLVATTTAIQQSSTTTSYGQQQQHSTSINVNQATDATSTPQSAALAEELTASEGLSQSQRKRTHERDSAHANQQLQQQQQPIVSSSNGKTFDVALLVTEQRLEPATNYLIAVHAINARGASKPLTLTASTVGARQALSNAAESTGVLRAKLRDNRQQAAASSDNRRFLSGVEALTFGSSSFIALCALSVAVFAGLASAMFALLKLVERSNQSSRTSSSTSSSSSSAQSKASSRRQDSNNNNNNIANTSNIISNGSSTSSGVDTDSAHSNDDCNAVVTTSRRQRNSQSSELLVRSNASLARRARVVLHQSPTTTSATTTTTTTAAAAAAELTTDNCLNATNKQQFQFAANQQLCVQNANDELYFGIASTDSALLHSASASPSPPSRVLQANSKAGRQSLRLRQMATAGNCNALVDNNNQLLVYSNCNAGRQLNSLPRSFQALDKLKQQSQAPLLTSGQLDVPISFAATHTQQQQSSAVVDCQDDVQESRNLSNAQFLAALASLNAQLVEQSPQLPPTLVMHEFENPYALHEHQASQQQQQQLQQQQMPQPPPPSLSSTSNTTNNSAVSGYATSSSLAGCAQSSELGQLEQLIISGKQYALAPRFNSNAAANNAQVQQTTVCPKHARRKD